MNWKYPNGLKRKWKEPSFSTVEDKKAEEKDGLRSYYDTDKVQHDGLEMDSKLEKRFYIALEQMKQGKYIDNFEYQVKFDLIPTVKLTGMKKANRKVTYKADFVVYKGDKRFIIDSKGYETDVFKLKKKIFEYLKEEQIHVLKNLDELHKLLIGGE